MAGAEILLASPIEWSIRATGTNVTVTASKASPGQAGFRHYVFGLSISSSAPPATSQEAQLRKDSGGTVLDGWQLSNSFTQPLIVDYNTHPYEGTDNGDMDLTIPALGAGITAIGVLKGTTRSRG